MRITKPPIVAETIFNHSRFAWIDAEGKGRNVFAIFRRSFELASVPEEALFHLFADTRYRLRVNGVILGYGPARFVPEHPEHDSYDLAPHLCTGENVLTVEVNHYGSTSAEAITGGRGGFIAAGTIGEADLGSPGAWKVRPANDAWDAHAIKASFIQSAVEVCDTRVLDDTWFAPSYDDSGWATPVEIAAQGHWGSLSARSVPMVRDQLDTPASIDLLAGLRDDEERIELRVFDPTWDKYKKPVRNHFIYAMWLHSPRLQTCTIGSFWGPHYLNGLELKGEPETERGNRENFTVALKEGWNLLYGEPAMVSEVWAIILGLPREAGLTARAEPNFDCPHQLKHTGHLSPDEVKSVRTEIPHDNVSLDALKVDWQPLKQSDFRAHPARMIRWDRIEKIVGTELFPHFPVTCNLERHRMWSLTVDMGREFHGHFVLDVEAPEGTQADVHFDEQKRPDGMAGRLHYQPADPADSYVLSGGRQRLEGFRTNGGRYIQIALRAPEGSETGEIIIHQLGIRSAEVPVNVRGSFSCSDPIFNWAWAATRDTFEVCQSDVYLPDVWRERGLAVADNRLSTFINRFLDPDMRVSRRSVGMFTTGLGYFAEGVLNPYMPSEAVGPHCEFSLIWPIWVADHWHLTGDDKLVRECLPTIERIVSGTGWEAAESSLWNSSPYLPFIDWGATREHQIADENACLNACRIAAVESLSKLCHEVNGDSEAAEKWAVEAERLRGIFRERLWLREEERFVVGTREGSPWVAPAALHANLIALRFGLVPPGKEDSVLDYLEAFAATNLERCLSSRNHRQGTITLLFLHYLLEVFYDGGRPAAAERVIREHWGYMKAQGAWTLWEKLTSEIPSSQCHVWGGAPLIHAGRNVLGIRQTEPGNESHFIIEPIADRLTWAEGRYPLSSGKELAVRWEVRDNLLSLEVSTPKDVSVDIAPRGPLARLRQRHKINRIH